MRPFFGQVRRRQVDRDPFGGQRKSKCGNRGAHALAAFGHGLVRQSHDRETHHAGCYLTLYLDTARFEPEISNRRDYRHHIVTPHGSIMDPRHTGMKLQRRSGRPVQQSTSIRCAKNPAQGNRCRFVYEALAYQICAETGISRASF